MKLLPIIPETVSWHDWRLGGIGGSDIGPIYFGADWPYKRKNLVELAQIKAGIIEDDFVANWAMEKGKRLEPIAIHRYQQVTSIITQKRCVEDSSVSWMRVTLDGIGRDAGRWRICEVKYLGLKNHLLVKNCGQIPQHYLPQLNWQMSVCELEECDFVSYCDDKSLAEVERLAIVRVQRDPALQAQLFSKAAEFWSLVTYYREKGRVVSPEVLSG